MIAMRLSEVHRIMEEATMNRDTYDKMILLVYAWKQTNK